MYFLNECQPLTTKASQQLETTKFELERAIVDVTSKVTNLVTLCLVGYLPLSVFVIPHSLVPIRQNRENDLYVANNNVSLVSHTQHSL